MGLEGTFEGQVAGAKWTEWDDQDRNVAVPVLMIPVSVKNGDNTTTLNPSLYFDSSIIDRGNDQGKTRLQAALEVLGSMGITVDTRDFTNNNPAAWPEELEGKDASVYALIKTDDQGNERQRCYLNRRSKPKISDERVSELWGTMMGGAVAQDNRTPAATPAPAGTPVDKGGLFGDGKDDDENVPF